MINTKTTTPEHTVNSKNQRIGIHKNSWERGERITFKGATIILTADFSEGTMEAIKQWNKTLKYQNKFSPKLEFYIQGK